MQDIHDIRPPVMVGLDPQLIRYALWALAGVVLLLAAVWLIRKFWKPSAPKAPREIVPEIPPLDAVRAGLDELAGAGQLTHRAFYFQLAALFKAYLGDTLGFPGREATTPELRRALAATGLSPALVSRISQFQEICDPHRYAPDRELTVDSGATGLDSDMVRDMDLVRELVDAVEIETAPPAEEEGA